ncbi:hypothetical protein [Pseudonocardia sp.]|uniref:hypothetical protein n=1 Tax=Pseudonocardia sp. TaxID=60912 RepID=UPI003D0D0DE4
MAEPTSTRPGAPARRRFPDLLCLVVGLLSLAVAGPALFGSSLTTLGFDARWLIAGAAVLLGLLMLVGSLRRSGT